MTNLEYACSLSNVDMPVINRVAITYIDKKVGIDAPLWVKETAYNEWCEELLDKNAWERARFEMTLSQYKSSDLLNFEYDPRKKHIEERTKKVKNRMQKLLETMG